MPARTFDVDSFPEGRFVNAARLILGLILVAGMLVLAACGGDEEEVPTPTPVPPAPAPTHAPTPTPVPPPAQSLLPCYTDLTAAAAAKVTDRDIPEILVIEMLERPYRIVPNDIILRQGQLYQLVIRSGNEWHQFRADPLGLDITIPPEGEAIVELRPERVGVFRLKDERKVPEDYLLSTIAVIPADMAIATWHPSCSKIWVPAPVPGASLRAPIVIEGAIAPVDLGVFGGYLHATRIEARSSGQVVGTASKSEITYRGRHSDFYIPVPHLPPGDHTIVLYAYAQNGTVVATARLPVTILDDPPPENVGPALRGSIDYPAADSFLELPATIRGWAATIGGRVGTGVGVVELWDGPRESGRYLTDAVYGTYRPDVGAVLGDARYNGSGWFARLSDLPAGPLDLRLYVRDRQTGDYVVPFESEIAPSRQFIVAEGKVADAYWPVALAHAPDGRLFFAELLTGHIRIWQDGQLLPEPFATVENVSTHSESGFMGLALHPDFANQPYVYAMYVVENPENGLPLLQKIVRFRDVNGVGEDFTVVLDNLPATLGASHNGGRIAFGPDGKLYVTIGDIFVSESAQDLTSLAGSILRYNLDGSIPADNPLAGSAIYAYGLRNVFGIAFQPDTGTVFATDNGPGGFDEVNRIEAGQNYGWPVHMGIANAEGFVDPLAVFGEYRKSPTYGPTGAAFPADRPDLLLFCAYHVPGLHALQLGGPDFAEVEGQMLLSRNCILDVTMGRDGWLYYSTVDAIYRARLEDLLRLAEQAGP